jgi:hypothetical protein
MMASKHADEGQAVDIVDVLGEMKLGNQGPKLWSQFSAKNAVFSKTNVMIKFFA